MDFEKARFNMVEQQIRPWDVLDMNVLETLMQVKRELFVAPDHQALAFADAQLPTLCGQTMLEPRVEGRALQALTVRNTDSVLDIGSGSGYMAALLAAQAEWVRSVEIEPDLAHFAYDNLKRNRIENVIVQEGDASRGWTERAPYDVIMVSGALPSIPPELLAQLKHGGRLFAFVGQAPVMQATLVTCVDKDKYQSKVVFEGLAPALRLNKEPSRFVF